jgi:hypothetical protein
MNRLSVWINHGLKLARWPVDRAARVALLVALLMAIASIQLAQSGAIVTANRRVEALRAELQDLRRRNGLLLTTIGDAASAARLKERAEKLGFQPAESIEFVAVPKRLRDDMPSLRDGYLGP